MKVLVISTTLRNDGNTDILADRFLKGARDAGHDTEKISLIGKDIGFCRGCSTCQETGRCVIKDDAGDIITKIMGSDVVAFATPIYFYGMAGQMKTLLDRTDPLYPSDYSFRSIYLLTAGGETEDGLEESTVKGLQGWIDCFDKCSLKGVVCAQGAYETGDVNTDERSLNAAHEMGNAIRPI